MIGSIPLHLIRFGANQIGIILRTSLTLRLVLDLVLCDCLVRHHQGHERVDMEARMPVRPGHRRNIAPLLNGRDALHLRNVMRAADAPHNRLVQMLPINQEIGVFLHLLGTTLRAPDVPEALV